jgi:hypothetical protein
MKHKHNKRRNTAFIYEALVKELTKAIVNEKIQRKDKIFSVLKTYFHKNSILSKELELYNTLIGTRNLESSLAERVVNEAKRQHAALNDEKIYEAQSRLIKQINKILSKDVFSNFVPDYRTLATVCQVFNNDLPPKKKVILEESIIKQMTRKKIISEERQTPIDKLTYRTFVGEFNNYYSDNLLTEQQNLLNKYITSFADNGIELKIFLNEEIGRIKKTLLSAKKDDDRLDISEKINRLLKHLETFRTADLNSDMIQNILKIQTLAREMQTSEN